MLQKPLEATGLHDSSLDSVQVSILDRSCLVRAVGVCGELPEGVLADIGCHDLESFFLLLDSQELSDNAWPGNIQDGHFDGEDCTGVLRLYLTGGMLEAGGGPLRSGFPSLPAHSSRPSVPTVPGRRLDGVAAGRLSFAVLTGLSLSVGSKQFSAQLLVLRDTDVICLPEVPERIPVSVYFEGVKSCTVRFDETLMEWNERLGNVASCIVDEKRGVCWFYLRNGIVMIEARAAVMLFD
ncbi:hypothetical protein JY458_13325 [Stenotrophomonas maltophilia]|nr:hypothetical protein [Stenotrophomonas maltophilia]